jgi:hypothetical protein
MEAYGQHDTLRRYCESFGGGSVCAALPPERCKAATCQPWRHLIATDPPEEVYDIRTMQELLDHGDVSTGMVYTQVLCRGNRRIRTLLDECRWRRIGAGE